MSLSISDHMNASITSKIFVNVANQWHYNTFTASLGLWAKWRCSLVISQNIGARGVHVWETGIWTPTYFCGFTSVFNTNQCLHKHQTHRMQWHSG